MNTEAEKRTQLMSAINGAETEPGARTRTINEDFTGSVPVPITAEDAAARIEVLEDAR